MSLNIQATLAGVGGWARPGEEKETAVGSAQHVPRPSGEPGRAKSKQMKSTRHRKLSLLKSEPLQDFTVLSGTTQNTVKLTRVQTRFRFGFRNKSLALHRVWGVEANVEVCYMSKSFFLHCVHTFAVCFLKRQFHSTYTNLYLVQNATEQNTYCTHPKVDLIQDYIKNTYSILVLVKCNKYILCKCTTQQHKHRLVFNSEGLIA